MWESGSIERTKSMEKEKKDSDRYEIKVGFYVHFIIRFIFTLKGLSAIRIIIMKIYQYFQICLKF